MEKQVKIFFSDDCSILEDEINSWLKKTSGKLHDIKFNIHDFSEVNDYFYCALAIYTPEEI